MTKKNTNFSSSSYSALKLYNYDYSELPKLVEPIFPKIGLVSLVGSSDTGKSTILRQLALSIALGLDDFIGYKITPSSKNVIYISTEDDPASTSIAIKKQVLKLDNKSSKNRSALNHLKFLFDVDTTSDSDKNILKLLNEDLSKVDVDMIIIDAFTDVFSGDINTSTKVREFLNEFNRLAKKHKCLILFLHHTGKRTDKYQASKNNILGSQAFEAKMRVVLELKHVPKQPNKRSITITKGNYISSEIKKQSKILEFDEENLVFIDTNTAVDSDSLSSLAKTHPKKDKMLSLIMNLRAKKLSIRAITEELKKQGFKVSKSTVDNYLKEQKKRFEAAVALMEGKEDDDNSKPEITL